MSNKNTVLYVGNFAFPYGNASGKRVYANGKVLRELGYNVIFIGMDKNISRSERLINTRQEYDGFNYYNLPYPQSKLDWLKFNEVYKNLIEFLCTESLSEKLALVIYYGSPCVSLFNTKLIQFCKNRGIKVVADCVDWLSSKTNNFLFDLIKCTDNNYQKAYANKKADGVITISRYLSQYYEKFNCKTVIIPPLTPKEYDHSKKEIQIRNKRKVITYAGLPFRIGQQVRDCNTLKDRIDKTIILLHKAKESGCDFTFHIYGFTKEEYLKSIPSQRKYMEGLGDNIVFHGHKSHDEVIDCVMNSDFTILIRDVNIATSAGFPTKVSESISCGTPVITNRTSDLEQYIEVNKNGFFLDVNDEAKAISKMRNILTLNDQDIEAMKQYCRATNPFDYKSFCGKMQEFLKIISC